MGFHVRILRLIVARVRLRGFGFEFGVGGKGESGIFVPGDEEGTIGGIPGKRRGVNSKASKVHSTRLQWEVIRTRCQGVEEKR